MVHVFPKWKKLDSYEPIFVSMSGPRERVGPTDLALASVVWIGAFEACLDVIYHRHNAILFLPVDHILIAYICQERHERRRPSD